MGVGLGLGVAVAVGATVAVGVDGAEAAATGDGDGADELVAVDEQAAATTRTAVSRTVSLWDAIIDAGPRLSGTSLAPSLLTASGAGVGSFLVRPARR